MKLLIIGGPTSTGKSALAHRLSKDLHIEVFQKDEYKERQFDVLSKKPSLKQMAKIEKESWSEMFKAIKRSSEKNKSLIVEGNFSHSQGRKIQSLTQPSTGIIEIFCYAKGHTILKRYIHRNKSGERHKGHRDHLLYPIIAFEGLILNFKHYRPLDISNNLLKVNADDFAEVNYDKVRDFVAQAM